MTGNNRNSGKPEQVRPIGPTRRSVSGYYPFRDQGSVAFESTLERDFLIRAAFSLSVLDVVAQPVRIPFQGPSGQTYTYTPDFLVYFRLDPCGTIDHPIPLLIEVKPESEWRQHWRAWSNKWKAAGRYARSQGWSFRIQDEHRIRDQMFHNVMFLERYKRMYFPLTESAVLLRRLQDRGSASVGEFLPSSGPPAQRARILAHIWHLLAVRHLDGDLSFPLNESTELWVVSRD